MSRGLGRRGEVGGYARVSRSVGVRLGMVVCKGERWFRGVRGLEITRLYRSERQDMTTAPAAK